MVLSVALGALAAAGVCAKLPPLSPDQAAKAAEAKAKAAHAAKVDAYELCRSMDRVAAAYLTQAKSEGKAVKPVDTPACQDPGPSNPPQAAAQPSSNK